MRRELTPYPQGRARDGWERPPVCKGRSEVIRAAWRQPGTGNLSDSVSSIPGLVIGSLYFVSPGGDSWPTVSYPLPIGPTPLPTAPEAWGYSHSDLSARRSITSQGLRLAISATRRFEAGS